MDGTRADDGFAGIRAGADPDFRLLGSSDQLRGIRADRSGADLLEHFEQGDSAGENLARRLPAGQPHSDHPRADGAGMPVPGGVPLLHRLDPRKRNVEKIKGQKTLFDFGDADLCLNEAGHGWVVSEYVPFVPCERKCEDAL